MEILFDPLKESILLWVHLPRLPLEIWNENIVRIILKPIGKLFKIDPNSVDISKRLFACDCFVVDISKPLKTKLKYIRGGSLYECFIDYENITNIFYGCGSQTHNLMLAL